jgi:HK97 family phage prohead protease
MSCETLQRRFLATGGITATPASRAGSGIGTLNGYAAVFDSLSHDMGGWRERIIPGAFRDALRSPTHPILALYDHTVGHLLGSTAAGTLALAEDSLGLRFTVTLPDTATGHDVLALATRGDLAGASFGFVPDRKRTVWEKVDGVAVSVIKRVQSLREVSVVALPAYPLAGLTSVTATTRATTPQAARARAAVERLRLAVAAG